MIPDNNKSKLILILVIILAIAIVFFGYAISVNNSNNSNGVTIEEWNQSIKEISEAFGCLTIDLQDCGINYDNISMFAVDDGLHPNSTGMTLIARKVASDLTPILEELEAARL